MTRRKIVACGNVIRLFFLSSYVVQHLYSLSKMFFFFVCLKIQWSDFKALNTGRTSGASAKERQRKRERIWV